MTTGNITGLGHAESSPSIQGDKITWRDDGSVIVYNISTGKEIKIVNASTPAIYGDNIVYVRSKYENGQPADYQTAPYNSLYLYNLITNKEVQLTDYEHATYVFSIYEDRIVWVQKNKNTRLGNISIYDIPTKRVSDISIDGRSGSPDIYGNVVVWTEYQNGSTNVYMRDIAKHKTLKIYSNCIGGKVRSPDIYGNIVMWTEDQNGSTNVYIRDIDKNKTSQIYTNWTGYCLSIYGDRIVWMSGSGKGDNFHSDIYMYNISTNETTRITNNTYAREPAIYDDKIVYIDSRSDPEYREDRNIYLYNLSA
ncbi:TolB family protein [Methanosarcina sp. T3]|uniref:TolB family protein n=1 Tax=Methanosarcina sp. T3 TaxID=3439062 RepID=UPI003F858633